MTRAYRCIFWHATHSFLLLTSAPHTFRGWTLPAYSVLRHSTVKLNSYNLDCCVLSPNSPFCGLLRTVSTYTFGVCTTSDVWLPQRISYLNKRLSQDTPPPPNLVSHYLLSRCQPISFELFAQNVTLLHVFPANILFSPHSLVSTSVWCRRPRSCCKLLPLFCHLVLISCTVFVMSPTFLVSTRMLVTVFSQNVGLFIISS